MSPSWFKSSSGTTRTCHTKDTSTARSPLYKIEALEYIKHAVSRRAHGKMGNLPKHFFPSASQRIGDTFIIDNADVYLKGCELLISYGSGLMPVEDYLLAMGVPREQKFRLWGRIPPWAKAALPKREKRVVQQAFIPVGARQIVFHVGAEVEVFQKETTQNGWAFGRCSHDGVVGWFPLKFTVPVETGRMGV